MSHNEKSSPTPSEQAGDDHEKSRIEPQAAVDLRVYDVGLRAWGTVVGAWLIQFCIIGMPLAFGVCQTFYEREYLKGYTASQIDWIGSLQLCLMYLLGLVVAGWFDAGYFRAICFSGCMLFVFSFFMLSLAKPGKYYQILLAQGVGMGIGTGVTYTPTSSVVSQHFRRRRSLAMGIITTGGAIGGFFFSAILGQFLDGHIGFAWGIRICAFICLACLSLANVLIRTQYPPRTEGKKTVQVSAPLGQMLRTPAYIAMILFGLFISLALYNPMFAVQSFAKEHPNIPSGLTSYLLAIINLSSVLGRTIPNALADKFGLFHVYIPCVAATGIVALVMTYCTTTASIVVFCVLYGFFSGTAVSLFFPAVLSLDPDVTRSGLRLGMASVPVGIASLVGTPIAGAVVGDGKWWAGSVFTGVLELVSAVTLLFTYLYRPRC